MTFEDRINRWKSHSGDFTQYFIKSSAGDFYAAYRISNQDLAALKGLSRAQKVDRLVFHMAIDDQNMLSPILQYGPNLDDSSLLLDLDTTEKLPVLPTSQNPEVDNHMQITPKQADKMIKGLMGKNMNEAVYTKKTKQLVHLYNFDADLNRNALLGEIPVSSQVHFWFGIYSKDELNSPPAHGDKVDDFPVLNAILTLRHEVKEGTDDCSYDYSAPCPPTC